jgi:UDP-N-acetylmuramoyl-tripeptide--D-alanyl-D-alanine ligase
MHMKPLSLHTVASVTGGVFLGDPNRSSELLTGVVRDNREIAPGNLFGCIQGERVDGHGFVGKAFAAGAACCLIEHEVHGPQGPCILVPSTLQALKDLAEYYRGLFQIPVIGVIGSVGKTTAKEMTASVLSEKFKVLKTEENLNNEIGVPLMLLKLRTEHEAAVIEMGISAFGEMSRLGKMVRPDLCLMTAIGHCHLDTLGDLNGVLKAKSEVFSYMVPHSAAVVNGDDALLEALSPGNEIEKITFGLGVRNDYRAENVLQHGLDCVSADLQYPSGRFPVRIPAFGSHMVLSALPAAVIGHRLGLTDEEIQKGLLHYVPVGGRANVTNTGYLTLIDDCYNANPNSVSASLRSLCTLSGRKVAILGDMKELGENAAQLHRDIGALAAKIGVDCLFTCVDLEREIHQGYILASSAEAARHYSTMDELCSVLPLLLQKGDSVLVKASHSMRFETIADALRQLSSQ